MKETVGILRIFGKVMGIALIASLLPLRGWAADQGLRIQHLGEGHSLIRVERTARYLLIPIEEAVPSSRFSLLIGGETVKSLDVHLAVGKVDYLVPVDLSAYGDQTILLRAQDTPDNAVCWEEMRLSDTFDTGNWDKFRPSYHFSPPYGWMNDPNGMVYKDGVYHLFYQHNPYGSLWGNLSWGHAISRDLAHWEHLPVAIEPDALGMVFSGNAVVDRENTAGFGKDAIVAMYTSASERQTQSLAYSLDNGRTFLKYEGNPVLTSEETDFRDPNLFWHEATQRWILVMATGQVMRIYSSPNLKDWTYESSFGEGQGAHAGVWECPDLFELPVRGTNERKWVLVCNLNPGGPFGGSATQYFVGSFDGHTFVNESPTETKWMDYGKDHYATVTWSNAPDHRTIALAWMSNWDYANTVPTLQYRSANSIPRDLSLYVRNGETYLSCTPSPEMKALRTGKVEKKGAFRVTDTQTVDPILPSEKGTYEMEITFRNEGAEVMGFELLNDRGEKVVMAYDLLEGTFLMDRRESGRVDFSPSFPTTTKAPIASGKEEFTLRLWVDVTSIEAFDGEGNFVMTNLVFPEKPYDRIVFNAQGGPYTVTSLNVYELGTK